MNVDKEYIRLFANISIKNICRDLGLEKDYMNVISGRASKQKLRMVRVEIEKRLLKLKQDTEL